MSTWINGRKSTRIDAHDRGLQYGDGIFETMRVRRGRVRLLEYHLERLDAGCRKLQITGPSPRVLRRELARTAALRSEGILKLIVTRGSGPRGHRPTGGERCTRVLTSSPLPRAAAGDGSAPVHVRLCATPLGINPALAGLKTLNRLESVVARSEWSDVRIWEGLMQDADEYLVCGTMSNLFVRCGSTLMTPVLDRCGVAGVMRRWILEAAREFKLRAVKRRLQWQELRGADEVFMSNAIVGVKSVAVIERGRERLRFTSFETAALLRTRLESL